VNLLQILELLADRELQGRTKFQGLDISIENRVGSVRRGVTDDGKPWRTKMRYPYGYILKTVGVDGDHVDCFVGPLTNAKMAYVIHTKRPPEFKKFDEDKAMLGFHSAAQAKKVFLQHYGDSRFFGGMDKIPMTEFKEKLEETVKRPQKLVAALEWLYR